MSQQSLPQRTHTYQNHILDSTHWDDYLPRDNDIVISTSVKSGTTWMQQIVLQLIFLGQPVPKVTDVSPWIDARVRPIADKMAMLNAQTHQRFMKSHLPLDGLPYFPQLRYIVVARDPRDVFMSFWNHYSNHADSLFDRVNDSPGRVGPPLPRPPKDIHACYRDWISRGWFDWEQEGYPYWGNMSHTQSWWNYRDLENVLLVHFNDLLATPTVEISRVATFLGMSVSDREVGHVAEITSFSSMKKNADEMSPSAQPEALWKGGAKTFFFKGTNGRWRDVLTDKELAMYETTKSKVLTPDCARWLEQGRMALS